MKKKSIFSDLIYKENGPAITLLLETEFTKEIRLVFKKNQVMKEHQAGFPIVIEIVEGAIDFGIDKQQHLLEKGDLITLSACVPHDLRAVADSIVRLTLSKNDTPQRVQQAAQGA